MVSEVNFSKREAQMMIFFEDCKGRSVTIDEVAMQLYKGFRKPINNRSSTAAFMRQLILRCKAKRVKAPERVTKIGRSVTAVYRLEGEV